MNTSKEQALSVAKAAAASKIKYTITDNIKELSARILHPNSECWYITYGSSISSGLMFSSSNLIVIRKFDGSIMYHGSANDEG